MKCENTLWEKLKIYNSSHQPIINQDERLIDSSES